jgi:hypothetical protein
LRSADSNCFSFCKALSSITFESNLCLTQIESEAFYNSLLRSFLILRSVEILVSKCFTSCQSLPSIMFESNSRLTRIKSEAFSYLSNQSFLRYLRDIIHSMLFWIFWSRTTSKLELVLTHRKFQRSSTGLNQQSIPINKPNHCISSMIFEWD